MDNTNDKKRHYVADNLVLKCGVPPYLYGCAFLTEAIELYAEGKYSFSAIYRKIAAKKSVTPKSITRDISYAISQSFDIRDKLTEIMGVNIPRDQIHNSLVISYLAHKLNELTDNNIS